jgi:DNA-binding transcriptional regulator GbsR (MarR family)
MAMKLTPAMEKFILNWGEMGARWGINRTVAQIHALLYVSPRPLHAEEISETLSVARSNVSNSIKELQSWGIIRVVHILGDRRDHFESMKDVWEMFRIVVDQRKKKEIDPTLAVLRECVAESEKAGRSEEYTRERLKHLLDFFQTMTSTYEHLKQVPTSSLVKFAKLGDRVRKVLSV